MQSSRVEKNCLVAEYRVLYRIGSHTIINYCSAIYLDLSQAGSVNMSGFRAVLDLDRYPLSNLIRARCAEWAKRGRGKPVPIMNM